MQLVCLASTHIPVLHDRTGVDVLDARLQRFLVNYQLHLRRIHIAGLLQTAAVAA
jgi:hypothetical protein